MQTRKRSLKLWNGNVPGDNNDIRMYVAATSRGKAAELITKASGFKVNSVFVKTKLNTVWGDVMGEHFPDKEEVWFFYSNSGEVKQVV